MTYTTSHNPVRLTILAGWSAALLLACSGEPTGPGAGATPPPGAIPRSPALVSAPPSSHLTGGAPLVSGAVPTAWVSMAPGTDTAAGSVVIARKSGGASFEVLATDGGFDPVPIPANAGDTLLITVKRHSGEAVPGYAVVPLESRPIIIRTSPPKGKTDVPLNAVIVVIFSEPMDSASLSGAVTLGWSGGKVSGTVRPAPVFGNPGLAAELVPVNPLQPATKYTLVVEATASSVKGEALPGAASATFTTGTSTVATTADTTAPTVTILQSVYGDTAPEGQVVLVVDISEETALAVVYYDEYDPETGGSPTPLTAFGGQDLLQLVGGIRTHYIRADHDVPGRSHAIVVSAIDQAGNRGADTITIDFVTPDESPWLVIDSAAMLEMWSPAGAGYWEYAPRIVVRDTSSAGGTRVVGFDRLTIPGIPPRSIDARWCLKPPLTAGSPTQLNPGLYGDYSFASATVGYRATGEGASLRLTVRDGSGRFHTQTVPTPIIPGAPPTTSGGGCNPWAYQFLFVSIIPECPMPAAAIGNPERDW